MPHLARAARFQALFLLYATVALAEDPVPVAVTASLDVSSPAFATGATIPVRNTCDGENLSPALTWGTAPEGTRAYALIVDDPDAPGKVWVHWLAWDIPSSAKGLPEGITATAADLRQGKNDFRDIGYGGPCPPKGHGAHRYFFRVYALDQRVDLPPGASRAELEAAMKGHVLAAGELMGKYSRSR